MTETDQQTTIPSDITLHDLYAAAAFSGLIGNGSGDSIKTRSRLAFEFADTMMEVRAQRQIEKSAAAQMKSVEQQPKPPKRGLWSRITEAGGLER
jgi:hypothetical protein